MPLNDYELKTVISWFEQRKIAPDRILLEKISKYYDLLLVWSKRINLVSNKDRERLLKNHILDSLGPLEMIPSQGDLFDIGSGAGFPGIPLAIVHPALKVTLLESIHKRILFLRAVRDQLGLDNIQIIESRLEDLKESGIYDIVTIRALPGWESHLPKIRNLLKANGKIIYYRYRGVYDDIK